MTQFLVELLSFFLSLTSGGICMCYFNKVIFMNRKYSQVVVIKNGFFDLDKCYNLIC